MDIKNPQNPALRIPKVEFKDMEFVYAGAKEPALKDISFCAMAGQTIGVTLGIVIEYGGGGARAGNLVADIFDAYYAMKDGSLTLDETGAGETADTTADGQDAVPETVENNDALAGDTAPAEQPAA